MNRRPARPPAPGGGNGCETALLLIPVGIARAVCAAWHIRRLAAETP